MATETNKNRKEEIIQNIKDLGQSLIDNAENMVGNYKYLGEIIITCYPNERDNFPYIEVSNTLHPESTVERYK